MNSLQALEWFAQRNKKSLVAGIVAGQGLKGRGGVPQDLTPPAVPAGFPQAAWEEANQRADLKIAELMGARTPAPPASGTRPFDAEAFCFGLAVGRSLEGWELDGAVGLPYGLAKIMYYIHIGYNGATVYVPFQTNAYIPEYDAKWTKYIDWGDGSGLNADVTYVTHHDDSRCVTLTHAYARSGDYLITIISDKRVIVGNYSGVNDIADLCYNILWHDFMYGPEAPEHAIASYDECAGKAIYTKRKDNGSAISGNAKINGSLLKAAYLSGSLNIGPCAFYNCQNLESVSIEKDVIYIGQCAFAGCLALENIILPSSLVLIGTLAFAFCESLESIEIPANVATIGFAYPYTENWLEWYYVDPPFYPAWHSAFTNAYDSAAYGFAMKDMDSDINRGGAFIYCRSLKRIALPDSAPIIPAQTFAHCESLESVTFGKNTNFIGEEAFYHCHNLADVTWPKSVKKINGSAFEDCHKLRSAFISDGVAAIEEDTFRNCHALQSVRIPASMAYIRFAAFYNCDALTDVYYAGTQEQWSQISKYEYGSNYALIRAAKHYESD